jgi:hypothetical protein
MQHDLKKIIDHVRNRPYMSGVVRDELRIKSTSEIFTPTSLVQKVLDHTPPIYFTDSSKTICDPSCGDGQFLGECLIRRIENGIAFKEALSTIYGVDIMPENVAQCRERLLCGQEHLRPIVERNIVCADALRCHYRFDGTDPYKTEKDLHFDKFFAE